MTERTIRAMAKQLAGQFYDMNVSASESGEKVYIAHRGRTLQEIQPGIFRASFPTVKAYLEGRQHGRIEHLPDGTVRHVADGSVRQRTPGWMHWYDQARQTLVRMLTNPTTHENIKEAIMAALIEDREKQFKSKPAPISQRHSMVKE